MKTQLIFKNLPDEFQVFLNSLGNNWDLVPGLPFVETEFDTMDDLYNLVKDAGFMAGIPIELTLSVLESYNQEDEKMMVGVLQPITPLF